MKDGAYAINLDDKKGKETHLASVFIHRNAAVYFDLFWIWM